MSTTFTLDTATSRAHPVPEPVRRLTVPAIQKRKGGEPIVMLTAYTARMAQLLDPHCDLLLVGDSLGQVIYGLDTTVKVSLDMMIAHGAAVVRGSYRSVVVIDLPFGSYEESPQAAFRTAARVMQETGAAAVKLEGGAVMAPTVKFLSERGIPVMAHVGLTPQAVNALGGYGARGRSEAEAAKILDDAKAVAEAGCFALVVEGVVEPLAVAITQAVACPPVMARCWWWTTCWACSNAYRALSNASTIWPRGFPMRRRAMPAPCGNGVFRVMRSSIGKSLPLMRCRAFTPRQEWRCHSHA
jgi:3-methyl-2-oxobutanoate hydroxymethyltransferase